jgi:uncharacterized membrane protein YhaH (DUF805 family)
MLTPRMTISTFLFSFKGRIGRQQWWLNLLLSAIPTAILDSAWDQADSYPVLLLIPLLFVSVAPVWWYLAVGVKRLHDCDMSGWWLLLLLVPYAGAVALFIIHGFIAGTQGNNRFGDPYGAGEPQAERP